MLNLPKKKLVSLLTAAAVVAGTMTAPATFGLGLGQPAVESFIGEPLRVRIPVSVATEAELESLKVNIAGADWYQQAGIERDPVVDTLLVGIERSPESAAVVITSADGLNQIMLPLLLEVSGSRMTLRKQVSVLLSPSLVSQPEDPWQDPLVEVAGVIGANTITSSVARPGAISAAALNPTTTSFETIGDTAAAGETSEAAVDADSRAPWPTTVRVQPGDSLSAIVNNLLPPGATRFQGRIAFYDRNPEAFEAADIHRLKADAVMVVPLPDEILAVPQGEALARYQALSTPVQNAVPAQLVAATTPTVALEPSLAQPDSEPVASSASEGAAETAASSGFRLSLHDAPLELLPKALPASDASANEATPLTDRADDGGLVNDESLLLADSEQAPRMQGFSLRMDAMNAYIIELQDENRFLKQRVASLEGNVDRLNNELASLNTRLLTFETRIGDSSALELETALEQTATEFAAYDAEHDLASSLTSPRINRPINVDTTPAPADDVEPPVPAESAETAENVASAAPATVATAATAVTTSSGASRVVMGEDLVSMGRRYLSFASQPTVQLIGGVVALALLMMIWMMRSSRRERELLSERGQQSFDQLDLDESKGVSFTADPENAIDPNEADGLSAQPGLLPDTDTLQDSDVDLITQAEVYLKYHRPSQAIQALREEYSKPDSDKYVVAMRLVEIFKELGGTEERNKALGNFISRVNEDIELFTDEQWISLRAALDEMRRDEQDSALNMDRKPAETADVLEPEIEAWERLNKL